jgi:death on curing protein
VIHLELDDIIKLQQLIIDQSGGSHGILDHGKLQSAVSQPKMTYAGIELYSALAEKAAAIGFSLTCNHAFIDGNKRIGHAAMELRLVINGYEIQCPVDEQEQVILQLASGELSREAFVAWVTAHCQSKDTFEKQAHGA